MIKLRVIQPGQPDQLVEVEGFSATIGRSSDCDVVVRQPYISKRHALILKGLVVVDLGSSNGTFIGEERLSGAALCSGGLLRLGDREVMIEIDQVDGAEAPEESRPAPESAVEAVPVPEQGAEWSDGAAKNGRTFEDLRAENHALRTRIENLEAEMLERQEESPSLVSDPDVEAPAEPNEGIAPLFSSVSETPAEEGLRTIVRRLQAEKRQHDELIRQLHNEVVRLGKKGNDPYTSFFEGAEEMRQRLADLEDQHQSSYDASPE